MDSKTKRGRLQVGVKHQERLAEGKFLVYRRPMDGSAGSWSVKHVPLGSKNGPLKRFAQADDARIVADGQNILTYDQAKTKAGEILAHMSRLADLAAGGDEVHQGPYTVADAWKDYIADAKGRGVQGVKIMQQTYDAQIGPELGSILVARLSKARISKWHQDLAEKGKRKTGKVREEPEYMEAPQSEEAKRQRRDSANRILTNLKSALNFALEAGKVLEPAPWHQVSPFPNTASRRVRFLSVEEQQKLVAGCDSDLRPLVLVGLFSGARYGELTLVKVMDFDPINGTLYIAFGKAQEGGTKQRTVTLTHEGADFLKVYTQGRGPNELMFRRTNVPRRTRAEIMSDPNQWAAYDQGHAMKQACKRSGVDKVTFHELRHSYASHMLNAGVNLSYLADQLGHSDLRMVTKYYGHIAESAMVAAIRSAPRLDLTGDAQAAPPTP